MDIGAFTLCLSVKNIQKSKEFYENIGFNIVSGDINQNWLVLKNGNCRIGIFQGILEKNALTFIPGWDQDGNELKDFTDVREIQKTIKSKGITLQSEADDKTKGPANFTLEDPDGNSIFFDQYI